MTRAEVIKRINTNIDWFPKSYAGYLFGIHIQAMGVANAAKIFSFSQHYGIVNINRKKAHWDWFWDSTEMQRSREKILEQVIKDKNFADSFFNVWEKRYLSFVTYFDNLENSQPQNFNESETFKRFQKLYELAVNQTTYGYVVDSFLTSGDGDWLVEFIKNELGAKTNNEVMTALTASTFSSFVNDYEIAIAELAMLFQKKDENSTTLKIDEIEKNFFWINTNYIDHKRLNKKQIRTASLELAKKEKDLAVFINDKRNAHLKNATKKLQLVKSLKASKGYKMFCTFPNFLV